ncbi:MAG: hypothetical protein IKQ35_01755 [Bacilli bacterium]|nr:hypothetical protein [Bacilli bacterium]
MKKIPFTLIALSILFEPVYAMSEDIRLYTNILAGGLVFIGVIIIIVSKVSGGSKEIYVEKEKNEISGLTDKDKLNEIKEFDPDSIFKVLPTFSSKKFEDETKEELAIKLKDENTNLNIIGFKITDFKEEEDKFIIKSWANIETGEKKTKVNSHYTVTSINKKLEKKEVRCPVCGGKIKDLTKLRCTYCGSILPNNNEINNDEWKIESIEKTA